MKIPEWAKEATVVNAVTAEVGFHISDSFYLGPGNRMTAQQWHELREPLYQPRVKIYKDRVHQKWILTQTLQMTYYPGAKPNIEELITHYLDVIRISQKHQHKAGDSYFWMRPIIYTTEQTEINFPFHDTWRETESFLEQMSTQKCGRLFSDAGQGWEVDIYATPEQLFLREGVLCGEKLACFVCNRQDFAEQIPSLRKRTKQILNDLCLALGKDYWLDKL